MKIAFIKSGTFSHINESVRAQLAAQFPKHEVVTVEVRDVLRRFSPRVLGDALRMLGAYGVRELWRRRDPVDCFIQSPGTFATIRREVRRQVSPQEFLFTFQTQSMWDASVPGIPHFLYTDHTDRTPLQLPDCDRSKLLGDWWVALERQAYRNASRVFTMSQHVRRSVIADYGCPAEKVECIFAGSNVRIPDAVDTSAARYAPKSIVFVGVDWERKGGPELLAAFQKISARHPDATLTIIGCSPDVKVANVKVLGRLPLAEVAQGYLSASIFCLPTRHEPFGIAFLEAMHHGLPIVGPDMAAIPDFVEQGRNGFLFRRGDVNQLAEVLDTLLSDAALRQRMGERSLALARDRYTWDKVGCRLHAAIAEFLPSTTT